jgi:hypothetical protein
VGLFHQFALVRIQCSCFLFLSNCHRRRSSRWLVPVRRLPAILAHKRSGILILILAPARCRLSE